MLRWTRPGSLRRATAIVLLGTLVAQAAVALTMPVLTRLYEPADFGVFAVFAAVESIIVVAAALRLDQAVVAEHDDSRADRLLFAAIVVGVGVSVVVALVAMLGGAAVTDRSWSSIAWLGAALGVGLAVDAAGQSLSGWATRGQRVGDVASSRAVQGVGQAAAHAGLGVLGLGPVGLVLGWLVGRLAALVPLLRGPVQKGAFSDLHASDLTSEVRRAERFLRYSAPAALLNAASLQMPVLLLGPLYGTGAAGSALITTRLVALPMTLVGQSAAITIQARIASDPDRGAVDLRPLVVRAGRGLLLVAGLMCVPLVLVGPPLFAVALGDEWRLAGDMARLLSVAFAAQLVVSPFAWILIERGRQDQQLIWDLARLLGTCAALAVPAVLGASVDVAVAALAAVFVLAYLVLARLIWRCARPSSAMDRDPT